MSASVKRPVGRPPTFTGYKSVTKVRLRLRGALADVLE